MTAPTVIGYGRDPWTGDPYQLTSHVDALGITRTSISPLETGGDLGAGLGLSVQRPAPTTTDRENAR